MQRALPAIVAILFGSTSALGATTWSVDDDGGVGVDFTDLPPAVAAALPGDLILVAAGSYSPFALSEGLTILATESGVQVSSGSVVDSIPMDERVVLADLDVADLFVRNCVGAVVLERLTMGSLPTTAAQYLHVENCADVRLSRSTISGSGGGRSAVLADGSRLEVAQSTLAGAAGTDSDCGSAGFGGDGIRQVNGGKLHVAASSVAGGKGGDLSATCISFCGGSAGDGGSGVSSSGGEVVLSGRRSHALEGGMTGVGEVCDCDGFGGTGVSMVGPGEVRHSLVSLVGGPALSDCTFHAGSALGLCCGAVETIPTFEDPSLELLGDGVPGTPLTFTITGAPGSNVRIFFGLLPLIDDTPPTTIEQLIRHRRNFFVGSMPASGVTTFALTTPTFLTQGTSFHAQVELRLPDSTTERTNSMTVVVR